MQRRDIESTITERRNSEELTEVSLALTSPLLRAGSRMHSAFCPKFIHRKTVAELSHKQVKC